MTPSFAHYRPISVAGEGSHKAFALVEGAVIEGQTEPDVTIVARTEVGLGDYAFTHTRRTTADMAGNYSLRVAHPEEYGLKDQRITVPESAVLNGTTVQYRNCNDGRANPLIPGRPTIRLRMPETIPGIDTDPDKQGGEPCLAGTRVPVRRIGHLVTRRGLDPAEIAERFALSLSDVHRALAYYYDHPDEMQEYDNHDRTVERRTDDIEQFEAARERLEGDS